MKTTRFAAVSIAAILALTGAAAAQNMSPGGNPDPNELNASPDAAGGFDSLMTTLNANTPVDLSGVTDTTSIRIQKLSALDPATVRAEDLDAALQSNAAARNTLTSNLEGNAAIKSKLDAEGVAAGDVIAVSSEADGSLVIWVDDRM